MEALEDRIAPSMSAILCGGSLTIADTDAIGKDNSFSVVRNGTDLVISDVNETFDAVPVGGVLSNGDKSLTMPLALINGSVTINGQGGNDPLTVDLAAGNPIPAGALFFNGGNPAGAPGDKLIITGGSQGTATYNYTNAISLKNRSRIHIGVGHKTETT